MSVTHEMTPEQAKALAERWAATDFEWQPGMRDGETGGIVVGDAPPPETPEEQPCLLVWLPRQVEDVVGYVQLRPVAECWPDLRHPGTLGFAVAAMRAKLGNPLLSTRGWMEGGNAPPGPIWDAVQGYNTQPLAQSRFEAEAVILALEVRS